MSGELDLVLQTPVDINSVLIESKLDEQNTYNLKAIWNRKKGELFYADTDGKLNQMGFWKRICCSLSTSYKKALQRRVKQTIQDLTNSIDTLPESKEKEAVISQLFFCKLATLSRNVYSRDLKDSTFQILSSKITFKDEEVAKSASEKYKAAHKAAKLWARLGNIETLGGGSSGSYRIIQGAILQADGKERHAKQSLGIFKPSDEEPLAPSNKRLLQKIKAFLYRFPLLSKPIRGSLFKTVAGQAFLAEASTKIVERRVVEAVNEFVLKHSEKLTPRLQKILGNIELVTDTQVAFLDLQGTGSRIGSFQLWVEEEHQEAGEFFQVNEYYKREGGVIVGITLGAFIADWFRMQPTLSQLKEKLPSELFDLLVIIDYITGNGDRHALNWFITVDSAKQSTGIRLIDGGQALAPKHPGFFSFPELHKRYLWRNLALAKDQFTEVGKFVINKLHEDSVSRQINDEIQALYDKHQESEKAVTECRLKCLRDRLEVLHRFQDKLKSQLAQVRTGRDFRKHLA